MAGLLLPGPLAPLLLRALGHDVAGDVRIGFSFLRTGHLSLGPGARIGHFNLILAESICIGQHSRVGHMNLIRGPLSLNLEDRAAIGNRNVVARAPLGVTFGPAELRVGMGSKITAGHSLDCACSITIGQHSILAGKASQIWTHGYVHDESGAGRYRVDGTVTIGDNVYIGSSVVIIGGVRIASRVIVGVGVTVARDLDEEGFFVSAPLRKLPRPASPDDRDDLISLEDPSLIERVYRKSIDKK